MQKFIQTILLFLGRTGCYFLGLCYIASKYTKNKIDVIAVYLKAVDSGWMGDDCYIINGSEILNYITGLRWKQVLNSSGGSSISLDYAKSDDEEELTRYEIRKEKEELQNHFVNTDGKGNIENDSMKISPVVRDGIAQSKRIYRRIK